MSPVLELSTAPDATSTTTTNGAGPAKNGDDTAIFHRGPIRPPTTVSAEGMYFTLADGSRIIDAVGGAAVTCIGNGNRVVIEAMKEQLERVCYAPNAHLTHDAAEELAKILIDSSHGAFQYCSFFSGGSEAMEAVIKLARQYFWEIGQPQRTNFIARKLSYHGNTLGALALSGHPTRRKIYEAIIDHGSFHHVSPAYAARYKTKGETDEQYVERLAKELDDKFQELGPDTVIGFAAETVVGASTGCVPAPKGYFKAMKAVCDKYGALFILDEIMSGMGRMGTTHAWESFGDGVKPDIQAVAKGLGGGYVSIGAVLISGKVVQGIREGSGAWVHGHTYQAHPISAAGALAVQKVIRDGNLLLNCRNMGIYLESRLHARLLDSSSPAKPYIFDIRGGGLFWAVEFELGDKKTPRPFAYLVAAAAMKKGLIILAFPGMVEGGKGDYAMLAPPYNVTEQEIDVIVDLLAASIEECVDTYLL